MHYTSDDMHVVFRLNPYGCIATGREEGMIEIVTHSMTISKIQLWYNHGAFDKESLYEWLKFHNPNEERSVIKINTIMYNSKIKKRSTLYKKNSIGILVRIGSQYLLLVKSHQRGLSLKWDVGMPWLSCRGTINIPSGPKPYSLDADHRPIANYCSSTTTMMTSNYRRINILEWNVK